jgi:hypothetical protein
MKKEKLISDLKKALNKKMEGLYLPSLSTSQKKGIILTVIISHIIEIGIDISVISLYEIPDHEYEIKINNDISFTYVIGKEVNRV